MIVVEAVVVTAAVVGSSSDRSCSGVSSSSS